MLDLQVGHRETDGASKGYWALISYPMETWIVLAPVLVCCNVPYTVVPASFSRSTAFWVLALGGLFLEHNAPSLV
jgi:hypothetical protein